MTRWVSPPFSGPRPWCLRCEEPFTTRPGAMSKMTEARDIEICSACGNDEGFRSARGLPPIPMHDWPIDPSLRQKVKGELRTISTDRIISGQDR